MLKECRWHQNDRRSITTCLSTYENRSVIVGKILGEAGDILQRSRIGVYGTDKWNCNECFNMVIIKVLISIRQTFNHNHFD